MKASKFCFNSNHIDESLPFFIDKTIRGTYQAQVNFDFKKYFKLNDEACLYYLPNLYSGLLYYPTLIRPFYPCKQEYFEAMNNFSLDDLTHIENLSQQNRIVFFLTTDPIKYKKYSYLQPIFERIHIEYVPMKPVKIHKLQGTDEDYRAYENLLDGLTEIPHIKSALKEYAKASQEEFNITEIGLLQAVSELKYRGYLELHKFAWDLILKNPDIAFDFVFAIKRLLLNPDDIAPQFINCWSYEALANNLSLVGNNFKLKNISLPGEIGACLETQLSYPSPTNWNGLKWCEDNLDVSKMRKAFTILDKDISKILYFDRDPLLDLKERLNEIWNKHKKDSSRLINAVYWGGTLSLGAIGTLISGPLIGLLSSFGLTALSNTLMIPFSERITKQLKGNSFHIWKLSNNYGEKSQ